MEILGAVVKAAFGATLEIGQGRNVLEAFGDMARDVSIVGQFVRTQRISVLIHDFSDGRGFLGVTWDAAGVYEQSRGRFQHVIRATSWVGGGRAGAFGTSRRGPVLGPRVAGTSLHWRRGAGRAHAADAGLASAGHPVSQRPPVRVVVAHVLDSRGTDGPRPGRRAGGALWCRECDRGGTHEDHRGLVVRRAGGGNSAWSDGEPGSFCLCTDMSHWTISNN